MKQRTEWILLCIGLILFTGLIVATVSGALDAADHTVSLAVFHLRSASLNTLMEGITYLGSWQAIVIICLLLLAYDRTRVSFGLPVAASALVTAMVKAVVKALVRRPRPEVAWHLVHESGWSFPSGHAITGFAVYGLLFALCLEQVRSARKRWLLCTVSGFLAVAIGLSRIYLGVHYLTDVLAGWSFGLAAIAGILLLREHIRRKGYLQAS